MFCGAKAPEQSFLTSVHAGVSAARGACFLSRLLLLPPLLLFFFFFSVVRAWLVSRIKRREAFLWGKKFALNPVFQIVVKLWFVFVCFFSPLFAFPLKFLQGSRNHESLGRENRQTSTEKSFKVSLWEREKWVCAFTILVGVFEDRRVEEASKAQREREREVVQRVLF
jgi:hypothetical protein